MSGRKRTVYDTRFIAAIYYPNDNAEAAKIRTELTSNLSRYISSITVYELYKLTLEREGKETADLRAGLLKQDFTVVNVDWRIAIEAARLWKKYHVPTADALIAATALNLKATCVSNDEHFAKMKELRIRWI
jgi:predicted nucleic acid-binding protein